MRDGLAITGAADLWLTHHSQLCRVVRFPKYGKSEDLEREFCTCGAYEGRYGRDLIQATNIVTTAGSVFYAQQVTNGSYTTATPTVASITNDFSTLESANDSAGNPAPAIGNNRSNITSKLTSSQQAATSGYPRVDDTDGDNTSAGSNVVTWQFFSAAAAWNATNISDAIITNTSPGASEPIATHFDESSFSPSGVFDKTSSDTLKTIYNVTFAAP